MDATQFIKEYGVEKAREVVEGAPDRTASHYVVDTDTYFSEKFHTYFDHSLNDWETADLHCVSDLEANYEIVLDLFDLKRLVKSIDLVDRLKQAIADYEQLFGNTETSELETLRDCGTSPNCKKFDEGVK